MKRIFFVLAVFAIGVIACSKDDMIEEPEIKQFTVSETSFPKRDTITYTINAVGDKITFFDGKAIFDLTDEKMPYTHVVGKLRRKVTPPADTLIASLSAVNIYSAEVVKEKTETIQLILLDE